MRIEETARLFDLVEGEIRKEIPAAQIDNILDNIGLPYSALNTQHLTNGTLGAGMATFWCRSSPITGPQQIMCARSGAICPACFPRDVLHAARRYHHADSQLRIARAHRRPD
jgi:hypothetical protein